jgi:hypothetical protein
MIFAQAEFAFAVLIVVSIIVFGGAAVWGLSWAFRNGQMSNFARGATSIFDPDEPVGEVTDRALAPRQKPGDSPDAERK